MQRGCPIVGDAAKVALLTSGKIHRTVILDAETDSQLQRLNTLCPVLSLHATHLAVVRAGLAALGDDVNMLMGLLSGHKGRLVPGRQTVKARDDDNHVPAPVASTKLGSLVDAMRAILGGKSMDAPALYAALKARRQLPFASNPLGSIRFTLSATSTVFRRVEGTRGRYELFENDPLRVAASSAKTNGNSSESDTRSATELQLGTSALSDLVAESDEFELEPVTAGSAFVPGSDIRAAPSDSRGEAAASFESTTVD